jgi:hypothetical protein
VCRLVSQAVYWESLFSQAQKETGRRLGCPTRQKELARVAASQICLIVALALHGIVDVPIVT